MSRLLRQEGWALLLKIIGEKHLYTDSERRDQGISSWLLFGAAIGYDGVNWDVGDWSAIQYPVGHVTIGANDKAIRVRADPSDR
jgi:hypothetical protein